MRQEAGVALARFLPLCAAKWSCCASVDSIRLVRPDESVPAISVTLPRSKFTGEAIDFHDSGRDGFDRRPLPASGNLARAGPPAPALTLCELTQEALGG